MRTVEHDVACREGWIVSWAPCPACRLVDPEPAGRSSLVSGTVAGDNLDEVEGQANGEGQGIGFDDADLGAVEPGVRGEGTSGTAHDVEHRDDDEDDEQGEKRRAD